MSLDTGAILNVVTSHASAAGLFERVNQHESKNAPGNGLTFAAWLDQIGPARGSSGLAQTSALVVLNARIYTSMLSEPQDAIDPAMAGAVDVLMSAYSGDFALGGTARCVDLLGMAGISLSARAGYLIQDGKPYRVFTITLPIIVDNVWGQVA